MIFKGELKPLKAKSPGLTSAVQPFSQDSILPKHAGLWTRSQHQEVEVSFLGPWSFQFRQKWGSLWQTGGKKQSVQLSGNTGPVNATIYRGSGSSLLSGTQIPTFPLLQVLVSIRGCKVNPCRVLPTPSLPPEGKLTKNIGMMEYQSGGWRLSPYSSGTLRGRSWGKILAKSRAREDELNQIPCSVIFLSSNDLRKIQYDPANCASVL